ncbi:MAG: methylmalonyl-CoA mutase, partial [Serpentinimonas sp.]|nr:methylmalonyl-CoA mutase [Serpentinimonas sp.]
QLITALENRTAPAELVQQLHAAAAGRQVPVLGITGTGGAGKSSLTDELIRRLRLDQGDALRVALISIDPSRRKSGGALLGDRIRMNAIGPWRTTTTVRPEPVEGPTGRVGEASTLQQAQDRPGSARTEDSGQRVFMRSLATRDFGSEISAALPDVLAACKVAGFDLIIVETSGIGQGDAAIVPLVDVPLYVMTPEFGAPSQLEKIDMLDFAEFVAINKFDRKGALDALRDVCKQVQRNRQAWNQSPEQMPVFGTTASRFNDDGVSALYQALKPRLAELGLALDAQGSRLPPVAVRHSSNQTPVLPPARNRYLAEIATTVRGYKQQARAQARLAREIQQLRAASAMLRADAARCPNEAAAADDAAQAAAAAALSLAEQRE